MTGRAVREGHGLDSGSVQTPTMHTEFLGRSARTGTWAELAQGTFRQAASAAHTGRYEDAAALIEVSLLEAQELREVYEEWPAAIIDWLAEQRVPQDDVDAAVKRLTGLIGETAMRGIESAWPAYVEAARHAIDACTAQSLDSEALIEQTRVTWQRIHDEAVDRVSGMIDIAVRLLGEGRLAELWDRLLDDWYRVHARRYDLGNQDWDVSAHQLMVSIVDGFHAHLAGTARQGDIELIDEPDRMGFRFAPCGSGGRSVDAAITDGAPRSAAPFSFAVTTQEHDWAWNKKGICSYCVHCCLLNEVMPIDRLGYPTRVIDPPVWTGDQQRSEHSTSCTWWVYKHPSLVPDEVYTRVGRTPDRRPTPPTP